jgi:hypothetical protein
MRKLLMLTTALLAISPATAAAAVLPGSGSSHITVDLPFTKGKGKDFAKCYAPCTLTATAPQTGFDDQPFVVDPNGQWQGLKSTDTTLEAFDARPGETVGNFIDLAPASQSFTYTLSTPGFWAIAQTRGASPPEQEEPYQVAGSPGFFVLPRADKPAKLSYLSGKKLRPGRSVIRVKSSKNTVKAFAVTTQVTRGTYDRMPKVKCKKPAKNLHCFKLKKFTGSTPRPKAKIDISAYNSKSPAVKHGVTREVSDKKLIKIRLVIKNPFA